VTVASDRCDEEKKTVLSVLNFVIAAFITTSPNQAVASRDVFAQIQMTVKAAVTGFIENE